jgi:hypothetical protein
MPARMMVAAIMVFPWLICFLAKGGPSAHSW